MNRDFPWKKKAESAAKEAAGEEVSADAER